MINYPCGLYFRTGRDLSKRNYLPQLQLKSHTTINPVCFTTTLKQIFRNSNSQTVDQARYTFPLYDGVIVNSYTISYADTIIRGTVKQKDDAKQMYHGAVARGETAGLLESLPAGIFGVTIGNVLAHTDVNVEITYCGELKHDATIDGLRFVLPTSIAPRYGEYPGVFLSNTAMVTNGIAITVDIDMAGSAIRKVQSPSHPISVSMGAISTTAEYESGAYVPSKASATLTLGSAELSDDFVLQMLIDNIDEPRAILETHPTLPNHRAIMATLVPRFTLPSGTTEIVFVVDQSGSMQGPKNSALIASLKVFLKSLPFGVRFNICAFGDSYKFLWEKSRAYNESNLKKALSFARSFQASYGGTEILPPIRAAFENRLSDLPLEVMLLTDGEVWAEQAVFKFINQQIHDDGVDARLFALGIGSDVSHSLVEGVARAGNGFAQFVTENEEIDKKVIRMLKGALYAHTKNYEIEVQYEEEDEEKEGQGDDFELVEKVQDCLTLPSEDDDISTPSESKVVTGFIPKAISFFDRSANIDETPRKDGTDRYAHLPTIDAPKLLQVPSEIPPLFPFSRSTIYLLLGPETAPIKVCSITLRATSAEGPLELKIPVHYSDTSSNIPTIHQLAAGKAVHELEAGRGWLQKATSKGPSGKEVATKAKYASRFDEMVEREAVRLGEKFQVTGRWTSFVAVQDNGKMTREVNKETGLLNDALDDTDERPHEAFKLASPPQDLSDHAIAELLTNMGFAPQLQSPNIAQPVGSSSGALPRTSSELQTPIQDAHINMCGFRSSASMSPIAPSSSLMDIDCCCAPSEQIYAQYGIDEELADLMNAAASDQDGPEATRPQSTSTDPMRILIDLQEFSGCWKWESALFETIGLEEASVPPEMLWNGDKTVCATALAVAFLEKRLSDRKGVWEMVVQKGRNWLVTAIGSADAVVQRAEDYV